MTMERPILADVESQNVDLPIETPGSADRQTEEPTEQQVPQRPTLDDLLPVKKGLAPSWGDSIAVRGIRAFLATHGFFAGTVGVPHHIHQYEHHVHLKHAPNCRILVFLPSRRATEQSSSPKGVLVHFHGGGWSICHPEMEAAICRWFADNLNCVVIAPDYAKAPELYFPHALRQAHGLLSWISAPAEEDGLAKYLGRKLTPESESTVGPIDYTRLILTGGSSGGNIATAVTLLCNSIPLPRGAKVSALGLQYPGLDLAMPYEDKFESLADKSQILPPSWASKLFLRCFLPTPYDTTAARCDPFISPGRADQEELRKFPPTQIVTSDNDHYRIESETFAATLQSLDVPCQVKTLPNVAHAFDLARTSNESRRQENDKARVESWTLLVEHIKKYI